MELLECGKTYYVNEISKNLDFEKVHTIRTRNPRKGEDTRYFVSKEKLDEMYKNGDIAYKFSVFGGEYGYLKSEIFSDKNMIFEMHYTTIYDWKKIRPDIKTIYIFPKNLDEAKQKLKNRNLPKELEEKRLKEIDEHYNKIMNDENLRNQFDYFFYNNYDETSEKELFDLVNNIENK